MNVYDELKARGMIAQATNEEKIRELLGGNEPVTFYIGFDPDGRQPGTWAILFR